MSQNGTCVCEDGYAGDLCEMTQRMYEQVTCVEGCVWTVNWITDQRNDGLVPIIYEDADGEHPKTFISKQAALDECELEGNCETFFAKIGT